MNKFVSTSEAISCIRNGSSLGISAFGGWLGADELYAALRQRFIKEGQPNNLHICGGILPGDLSSNKVGMNLLTDDGLVSKVTAAHVGMAPLFSARIAKNEIPAFGLPLGVFTKLLRATAAHEPGLITAVGKGTFCDPELEACRLNKAAEELEAPVSKIELYGKDYLFYPSLKLDACFIRASCADEDGNLSMVDEPIIGDQFLMAAAVHNQGGKVIAQVNRIVKRGSIRPRDVFIHASMVDYIVQATPEYSAPGYDCPEFRPELVSSGVNAAKASLSEIVLNQRTICARRAAQELKRGSVINIGIGIPEGIAEVSAQEKISSLITLSVESGPTGGVPVGGVGFGAAMYPQALYPLEDNFDFYDGGGLDMAFLGAAEIDEDGNVNVSAFPGKVTGPGGFINISQNTSTVCFMGTFTAGGLKAAVEDGELRILYEGRARKFRKRVQQVTFSAKTAKMSGQRVLYITERAVFALTEEGLMLTEAAPGIDIEKDIFAQMDFVPKVSSELKLMDEAIFRPVLMGIADRFGS